MELPYDPAILLLDIYPEKSIIPKDACLSMFSAALFTKDMTWKQPKCPSTEECIKMWYIYAAEYYSTMKMKETGSFRETWMDQETVIQSEVRKSKTNTIY